MAAARSLQEINRRILLDVIIHKKLVKYCESSRDAEHVGNAASQRLLSVNVNALSAQLLQ